LNLLKELEKEVITIAAKCGHTLWRFVSPEQLFGIEINPYAAELARLVVWIGHIQWDKNNGLYRPETPILTPLKNIKEMDAILDLSSGTPAEPKWPDCEVIVGNPPFLGGNRIRKELGDVYVNALFEMYKDRVSPLADLCCYWFDRARRQIDKAKCKRAGLLATQSIRGGANRDVLKRIKNDGDIFFAVADRDWILDGANVHISMVGFDDGSEECRVLDGQPVRTINAHLGLNGDISSAAILKPNLGVCCRATEKGGAFELDENTALEALNLPQPKTYPNSNVLRLWTNGQNLVQTRKPQVWIVDYYSVLEHDSAALYEWPFAYLTQRVKTVRAGSNEARQREAWWLFRRSGEDMRKAIAPLDRYLATAATSKHRIFVWVPKIVLPDHQLYVFAREDDYFFGVLHSRLNEVWSRVQGTQVRERESGFRYTPTTCFETFPLPHATPQQEHAIAATAKELDTLRNAWLNPPDWTREETLTFPGSVRGPWARYVTKPNALGIGTVRYPRLIPADAEAARKLAKRTLTNLYNERPAWLDLAHRNLDEAVSAAYGWLADLSDEQILEKLLALNLERATNEQSDKAKK
jgi:type II restriction/modification system DNA methylase subunit YeeA